jgi:hypothetical protein
VVPRRLLKGTQTKFWLCLVNNSRNLIYLLFQVIIINIRRFSALAISLALIPCSVLETSSNRLEVSFMVKNWPNDGGKAVKRDYVAPRLVEYGDVKKLTEKSGGSADIKGKKNPK